MSPTDGPLSRTCTEDTNHLLLAKVWYLTLAIFSCFSLREIHGICLVKHYPYVRSPQCPFLLKFWFPGRGNQILGWMSQTQQFCEAFPAWLASNSVPRAMLLRVGCWMIARSSVQVGTSWKSTHAGLFQRYKKLQTKNNIHLKLNRKVVS